MIKLLLFAPSIKMKVFRRPFIMDSSTVYCGTSIISVGNINHYVFVDINHESGDYLNCRYRLMQ